MRQLCWLIMALMFPLGATGQSLSPGEVVDAFHRSLADRDSIAAMGYLAADVVIFESGGVEQSREEYAGHHLGADMAFAGATNRVVTDRTEYDFGDAFAVLSETGTTGRVRDRDIDSRGVETMILRKTSEGWRIVHIHWSSRRGG